MYTNPNRTQTAQSDIEIGMMPRTQTSSSVLMMFRLCWSRDTGNRNFCDPFAPCKDLGQRTYFVTQLTSILVGPAISNKIIADLRAKWLWNIEDPLARQMIPLMKKLTVNMFQHQEVNITWDLNEFILIGIRFSLERLRYGTIMVWSWNSIRYNVVKKKIKLRPSRIIPKWYFEMISGNKGVVIVSTFAHKSKLFKIDWKEFTQK